MVEEIFTYYCASILVEMSDSLRRPIINANKNFEKMQDAEDWLYSKKLEAISLSLYKNGIFIFDVNVVPCEIRYVTEKK